MNDYLTSLHAPSVATGAVVAFLLCSTVLRRSFGRRLKAERDRVFSEMWRTSAIDRSNYLAVLKRELANELVRRNPTVYLQNYYRLLDEIERIQKLTEEDARMEFDALCVKYKHYTDFDIVQARDYVLYSDALDWEDDQEIIRTYNDIVSFCLLQGKIDADWHYRCNSPHEQELKHLERYVRRIEDTIFFFRLRQAERDYRSWQANCEAKFMYAEYENAEYAITPLSTIPEMVYGVRIKATQEYGKFSVLYGDNDNEYRSYYRSDRFFKKEEVLDKLNVPVCIPDQS